MAISEAFAGSENVTNTEWSLPRDAAYDIGQPQTGDGTFQCFLDTINVVAADSFRFRIYEKVRAGDTQRIVYEAYINGPQTTPIFVTPALELMHGWDVTLFKVSATSRVINWSIRTPE